MKQYEKVWFMMFVNFFLYKYYDFLNDCVELTNDNGKLTCAAGRSEGLLLHSYSSSNILSLSLSPSLNNLLLSSSSLSLATTLLT